MWRRKSSARILSAQPQHFQTLVRYEIFDIFDIAEDTPLWIRRQHQGGLHLGLDAISRQVRALLPQRVVARRCGSWISWCSRCLMG